MARASATVTPVVERCWTLVGERRGRIWLCRCMRRTSGERTSVAFDGAWVLEREETRHDVVGFLHTHPDGPNAPSARDVRTMRAWCSAFGKPLLCLIESPQGLDGFRFDDDESTGKRIAIVEKFARGLLVGVDDGR